MRFVIQKDCYGTILTAWLISIACIALLLWLLDPGIIRTVLIALFVVFMGFVTWFHRVPERKALGTGNIVTSVADGKVVVLEKVYEKEYLKRECIQVSVYMNFFDVHVNYWPIDGKVTYYKYHPGRYLLAFHPKASELNEHSSTALSNGKDEIFFKQIAGTFARRIVCYSEFDKEVKAGDQCGVIKFGSRIDMYLPLDADIKVKLGDLTVASDTVIAELK